jgi:hypothetical protein
MRTRRKGHGWWVAACGLVALVMASTVSASEVDVCVNVLENITGPVYEYRCGNALKIPPDAICAINPLCCTPQVCKVTPACGVARVITDTIAQAGDVHCFKGIGVGDLWQRWRDRQIAFGVEVLTGGVAEALLPLVKADINLIAASGNHLPGHLQELLQAILAPVYDHGNTRLPPSVGAWASSELHRSTTMQSRLVRLSALYTDG